MTWLLKAVFGGSNGMEPRSIRRDLMPAASRLTFEPISRIGPAFGRRCIPSGGVATPSHTPGMLGRRALPDGRLTALGAAPPFLRWVLERQAIACGSPRSS